MKHWLTQIRAPFLPLSVVLVAIGGAAAWRHGMFDGLRFALTLVGTLAAHIAVNLFNELSDHATGIDDLTVRTPFSGGTGCLQSGLTTRTAVRAAAIGASVLAAGSGLYLAAVSGWHLLLLVVVGGLVSVFYTTHLARWMIGEVATGVCLGTLVVIGAYFVQTSSVPVEIVWLAVPPGLLSALLLLLNEFPDVEADAAGGRRHLVIVLGRRRAAVLYGAGLLSVYLIITAGAVLEVLVPWTLLAWSTAPLAVFAAWTALRHHGNVELLVPAMGANVALVLGTDLALAAAHVVDKGL